MPKFVIEREIPGAGKLSSTELQGISRKSCGVLRELGPEVQLAVYRLRKDLGPDGKKLIRTIPGGYRLLG